MRRRRWRARSVLDVPFTAEQFLDVFARYNTRVWPAPVWLSILALVTTALALRRRAWADRFVGVLLAALWAWMGVAYHFVHFASINRAAWLFGAAFVLQAGLFVLAGMRGRLRFEVRQDAFGWLGAAMIAYALVVYPVLAMIGEHAYPRSPTFGLPCPTTIFTLGLLVWARSRVPAWLLVVPLAWSAIGSSAAFAFGIREDFGLAVAAVLTIAAVILGHPREGHALGSAPFDENDAAPQHRQRNAAADHRVGVRALGQ